MLNRGMARTRHSGVTGKARGSGPLKQWWKLHRASLDSDNPISCLPCRVGLSCVGASAVGSVVPLGLPMGEASYEESLATLAVLLTSTRLLLSPVSQPL